MKHSIILVILLLTLSACVVVAPGGETNLPVEYAALQNKNMEMREAIELIEPLMAAQGFQSNVIFLEREDAKEINRRYEGPSNSSASLRAKNGCISFVTWVKEGTNEYIAPKNLFEHVLSQLRKDASWEIQRGQICSSAA